MLDAAVLAHLDAATAAPQSDVDHLSPAERRWAGTREIDRIFRQFGLEGPPVERVADHHVPVRGGSILVRSYHPADAPDRSPAHVYLHGGGWTSGSIDELVADATARHRSVGGRCVTFLVEYRLAPEFPFPTPVHDVVDTIRWIRAHAPSLHIDTRRITVGGSSAGANLAAAAVLADPHLDLAALLLDVPALDLRNGGDLDIPDDIEPDDVQWVRPMQREYRSAVGAYLPDPELGVSPLATPLLAHDVSAFPETFLFTAQLDVLRPGAERFAEMLRAAGVPAHITCYAGALHGSPILNATWSTARRWHDDSLAILRQVNWRDSH